MLGALRIAADGQNDAQVQLGIDVIGRDFQNFLEDVFRGVELAEPDESARGFPEDLRPMNARGRILCQSNNVAWSVLFQRRADAVVQYLAAKYAVPAHRFYLIGIGKDKEVAPNDTADGRKKNRRVEIRLLTNMGGTSGQQTASVPAGF